MTTIGSATTGAATLVPLSRAAGRHDEVGVKAANLGAALSAGFPVPDGVVLSARTLEAILSQLQSDRNDSALTDLVGEALEHLGDGPLAVRSSAVAEDLEDASYAGQYETILGVEGVQSVASAVRRCWESARGARVAAYERSRTARSSSMAVLLQRLVPAEAAGVAFTANPVTGARDETLVSAVRGLGDRLVGGEATPDQWVVRGEHAECRRVTEDAIDATVALDVAALARRLEELFGTPQDVEWAVAEGRLFVLQARPITALPERSDSVEDLAVAVDVPPGFWERDASHFPLPLSPMMRSLVRERQNEALARAFAEHGVLADGLDFREIGGWTYARVVPPGGADGRLPPTPVMWLVVRLLPSLRRRLAQARSAVREDLAGQIITRWHAETRPDLQHAADALRDVPLAALDDAGWLAHWARVESLLAAGIEAHFRLHVPIALARFDLAKACRELLGWDESRAFELLSGLSATSTVPALELAELRTLAATRPTVNDLVERADQDSVTELPRVDPDFAAAFERYQRQFGVRARRLEVADLTLAETPELTLATLRDQLRQGYDGRRRAEVVATKREAELAEAHALLRTRTERERARFEAALERAEAAHPVHEENEFYTLSVPLGLARMALLDLGRRLAGRHILDDPEDVFLLERDEAVAALAEGDDLRSLVARRRAERAWALAHPGPATYGQRPAPLSLHVLPPEAQGRMAALLWAVELIFAAEQSGRRQSSEAATVSGIAASGGRYTGTVRVVSGEHEFDKIQAGDVLVCPVTSPVWSVLFSRIGALVSDTGGMLSHQAIIAREFGIPAVVATGNATALLRDGQQVTVDGTAGVVHLV